MESSNVVLKVKYEICGSKFFRHIELALAGQTVAYLQLPLKEVSAGCKRSSLLFFCLNNQRKPIISEVKEDPIIAFQAQTLSSLPALSTFYRF